MGWGRGIRMSKRGSKEWPIFSPRTPSLPLAPQEMGTWSWPEHAALLWSLAPPCGLRGWESSRGQHVCRAP